MLKKGNVAEHPFKDARLDSFHANGNRIFIITFQNAKDFADYFLRFSEFYECPKHAGTIFNRTEFDNWYLAENEDSYENEVLGINITQKNVVDFMNAFINVSIENEITIEEQQVLDWLLAEGLLTTSNGKVTETQKFSVLTVNKQLAESLNVAESEILRHELSHALYNVDADYRKTIDKAWESLTEYGVDTVKYFLEKRGYNEATYVDEFGAFSIDGSIRDRLFGDDEEIVDSITSVYNQKIKDLNMEAAVK